MMRTIRTIEGFLYKYKAMLTTTATTTKDTLDINGATVAEWLRSLSSNNLPLIAVVSNPDKDFGYFNVGKLFS
jgi:hypothetical protein